VSVVYLLHLERPYKHAAHYVGFAKRLDERLAHHANGTGARFLQVVRAAGIGWIQACVWPNADRAFERKLKNTHNVARYCPRCQGKSTRQYQPKGGDTRKAHNDRNAPNVPNF
jgi:predicted GIY-YIG superfamily endonuclease